MKNFFRLTIAVLFGFNYQWCSAHAALQLKGTQSFTIKKDTSHRLQAGTHSPAAKTIRLLNIELSDKAWQSLSTQPLAFSNATKASPTSPFPKHLQLGMNEVPVLDQGPYGTCVTFAATAAVDAAMNKGDYISQLCQLEFGTYLENASKGRAISGWDGSFGAYTLQQMETFGVVPKDVERAGFCGGLTAYPSDGIVPDAEMSIQEYTNYIRDMSDFDHLVSWSPLMDIFQATTASFDKKQLLMAVKKSLNEGDRLTFGVLIFLPEQGVAGAVGQHAVANDTWVITPLIETVINMHGSHAGHEMIITGYDDEAVAVDGRGRSHKGLLTLRNSWGNDVGDGGNFYMSYDYFTRLAIETQRIRQLN